ncbi:unnamed protein product [Oikopleura dioica]|uniref:Sushi domain-containing protein n=1 Tax=Oikopleura dioica TaxID=34765 RepID=E4WT41_OIKDI|nr:unnamed protein product [Oikopleura dioica]
MECTAIKKWNPEEAPICVEIVCPVMPKLENGNTKCSDENRHQSICRFVCGEGYRLKGSRSSICTTDGKWSAEMPVCEEIICDELAIPQDGSKDCSGDQFGQKCSFMCNTGFDLSGSEERTCQADGTWTGVPVHCNKATCGLLPKCGRDRSWDDFPPFCQINRCEPLTEPSNGRMFCVADNTFGSECAMSCNMGYMLRGSKSRTCGADQKWSGEAAECVAVQCEAIHEPEYGTMICSKNRNFGSICTINCDSGYDLIGPRQRACGAEGRWSGLPPTCELIHCGPTTSPQHGNVTCSMFDQFGSQCQYECNEGYKLVGSNSRVCQESGAWTGIQPVCELVQCRPLASPENAFVACSSGNDYNSRCRYVCTVGFELVGSDNRVCQSNGRWTGDRPYCEQPRHGSVQCSAGGDFGSVCSFTCDSGYSLVGSETRVCEADHAWSGSQPYCLQVTCSVLVPPANGYLSCSAGNLFNSICSFSCKTGFNLQENGIILLQHAQSCHVRPPFSWITEEAAAQTVQITDLAAAIPAISVTSSKALLFASV